MVEEERINLTKRFEKIKECARTGEYTSASGGWMAFDGLSVLGEKCKEAAEEINMAFTNVRDFGEKQRIRTRTEEKYNVIIINNAALSDVIERIEKGEL